MRIATVCLALLVVGLTLADHPPDRARKPAELLDGLGSHHHPVSTKNAEAQKFFDQGLTLLYAFNHDEAVRSFERAAELDPNLAMAWWGIALAKGPNYNLDADEPAWKAAYSAMEKARVLAGQATEAERDYIQTLTKRYVNDPKADKQKLALDYKNAMGELSRKYPDDLDAATLYAESAMNLRPWKLWSPEGKPAEGTEEILAVLEGVLRRNPDHPGANHYYIHAIEASPHPERGLPCADRLRTLVPAAGHLVHMPAHIYTRVGDYAGAVKANEAAIVADQAYLKRSAATGVYPMMYYSHNIHFLAVAQAMQGRYADAKKAADLLAAHVDPHVHDMPMLEGFMPISILVQVRFARWDDILALKPPPEKRQYTRAIWHFARTLAFAAKQQDTEANKERQAFLDVKKAIPADAKFSDWNTAQSVLTVGEHFLDARLALLRTDIRKASTSFRLAIKAEDALQYGEPADWILPVREAFAAALHRAGDYAEAEKLFREDLERNRRNGRSLFGLQASLSAQRKNYAARLVEQQFQAAWKNADGKLRILDF